MASVSSAARERARGCSRVSSNRKARSGAVWKRHLPASSTSCTPRLRVFLLQAHQHVARLDALRAAPRPASSRRSVRRRRRARLRRGEERRRDVPGSGAGRTDLGSAFGSAGLPSSVCVAGGGLRQPARQRRASVRGLRACRFWPALIPRPSGFGRGGHRHPRMAGPGGVRARGRGSARARRRRSWRPRSGAGASFTSSSAARIACTASQSSSSGREFHQRAAARFRARAPAGVRITCVRTFHLAHVDVAERLQDVVQRGGPQRLADDLRARCGSPRRKTSRLSTLPA